LCQRRLLVDGARFVSWLVRRRRKSQIGFPIGAIGLGLSWFPARMPGLAPHIFYSGRTLSEARARVGRVTRTKLFIWVGQRGQCKIGCLPLKIGGALF
jgi:hypothetical protein